MCGMDKATVSVISGFCSCPFIYPCFPLSCFPPHPPLPFFVKGSLFRVCWLSPVRLKSGGKKGQLTKQHFISSKFLVRRGGVSGLNPLLCWRAVCGVEVWHTISRWGKENFSSRVVTCLSPVSPSEACLPYPSSQGASYTQCPICSS